MGSGPPNCEFGLELLGMLPTLHARAVNETCSLKGTTPWYHWSGRHVEVDGPRSYTMLEGNWPVASLHTCSRIPPSVEDWSPPPMVTPARVRAARKLWASVASTTGDERPPVVLHNKICDEWGTGPVHRIPDLVLEDIATRCAEAGKRVLYIRPTGGEAGFSRDHNLIDPCATSDYAAVEAKGGVTLQTVMDLNGVDYNEAQVTLSCIADRFVSVQGGAAIVASYFGGRNLIYARKGVEIERRLYAPDSLVTALSNARLHVTDQVTQLPGLLHE